MTINVFISYDYTSDKEYASLLKAWAENDAEHFKNINFIDGSSDFSRESTKVNAFKNSISRRMNACDKILVLVGKETYKSDWCKWEIKKAEELELDFAAVNIEHANASPISLYGKGVKRARSFTEAAIESVLT